MPALNDYREFVSDISRRCEDIRRRYADQLACMKGCKGDCCRIHLRISAVEAFNLSEALRSQPAGRLRQIRVLARQSTTAGPCPLLDRAACSMYPHRLILCRTHGLPVQNSYRGKTFVGCCQKNFQRVATIADDARLDLDWINHRLTVINRSFINEYSGRHHLKERYLIAEALMLEI